MMRTSSPSHDGTARNVLRQATHQAHERVEGLLDLTAPDLTLGDYTEVVRRFAEIYTALERRIDAHAHALARLGLAWEARRKVPLLLRDLEALGLASEAAPTTTPVLDVPALETFAHAMGCLYVLEGATLGGKIIGRHVAKVLGLGPSNGASFFDGYGAATGDRWQELCALLELALASASSRERAVLGARATFRLFTEHGARREL